MLIRPARLLALMTPAAMLFCSGCAISASTPSSQTPQSSGSGSVQTGIVTEIAGLKIDHDSWIKLGYRWDWAANAEFNRKATTENVLAEPDFFAIQDSTTRITVMEPSSGRVRWSADIANPLTKSTSLDRVGSKLLASTRPELFVLDLASGNLLTRQSTEVVVNTPPAIVNGLAIYGTPPGELLAQAFGDRDGNIRPAPMDRGRKDWGYDMRGAIEGRPVLIGDNVAAVSQAGEVGFFDYRTGASVGKAWIAGGVDHHPTTDGSLYFIASLDQSVYAFEPEDAKLRWRHRTSAPIHSTPVVVDGTLYVNLPEDGLTAFQAETGNIIWNNPEVQGDVVATRRGDLVVFTEEQAWLVDPKRGDTLEAVELPGFTRLAVDKFEDGNLYAIGKGSGVARFRPR